MKRFFLFAFLAFSLSFLSVGPQFFSSNLLIADNTSVSLLTTSETPTEDLPPSASCEEVNTDNPYRDMIDEEHLSDYEPLLQHYIEEQDAFFAEQFQELHDTSFDCELGAEGGGDPYADMNPYQLASDRLMELRQVDCALYSLQHHSSNLCTTGPVLRGETFACDANLRAQIARERAYLKDAFRLSFLTFEEAVSTYGLHKRLECVNLFLSDQRKVLRDIVEVTGVIRNSYPNSALNQ